MTDEQNTSNASAFGGGPDLSDFSDEALYGAPIADIAGLTDPSETAEAAQESPDATTDVEAPDDSLDTDESADGDSEDGDDHDSDDADDTDDADGSDDGDDEDDEGAEPELIFGKYKTIEDAEAANKELERSFHELAAQKRELEAAQQAAELEALRSTKAAPDVSAADVLRFVQASDNPDELIGAVNYVRENYADNSDLLKASLKALAKYEPGEAIAIQQDIFDERQKQSEEKVDAPRRQQAAQSNAEAAFAEISERYANRMPAIERHFKETLAERKELLSVLSTKAQFENFFDETVLIASGKLANEAAPHKARLEKERRARNKAAGAVTKGTPGVAKAPDAGRTESEKFDDFLDNKKASPF